MTPSSFAVRFLALPLALASLTACHREQAPVEAQRIALDQVPRQGEEPLPSPDTKGAAWVVSANGQSIDFERAGEKPWLSLACKVNAVPPQITVIRHVAARPGEKALFPVIGGGIISRFKVDAALADGEWRWQGTLPADDPLLEVFEGAHDLEATLPGGGTVKTEASGIPGQFLAWCRNGGKTPALQPTASPSGNPSASIQQSQFD
jgi:hypothetical protein